MKTYILKCQSCGANLDVNEGERFVYCRYCGTKNYIDDGTIRIHKTITDEARIKEAEVNERIQLRKINREEKKDTLKHAENKIRVTLLTLAWIFAFPITATVFIVNSERINGSLKIILVIPLWIATVAICGIFYGRVSSIRTSIFLSEVRTICSEYEMKLGDTYEGDSYLRMSIQAETFYSKTIDEVEQKIAESVGKLGKKVTVEFEKGYSSIRTVYINKNGAIDHGFDFTIPVPDKTASDMIASLTPIVESVCNEYGLTLDSMHMGNDYLKIEIESNIFYKKRIDSVQEHLRNEVQNYLFCPIHVTLESENNHTIRSFTINKMGEIDLSGSGIFDRTNSFEDNEATTIINEYKNAIQKTLKSDMLIRSIEILEDTVTVGIDFMEADRKDVEKLEEKIINLNKKLRTMKMRVDIRKDGSTKLLFGINRNGMSDYSYNSFKDDE